MTSQNEEEMLKRDIETLKERIKLEYAKQASKLMTPQEMATLNVEIRELQAQLDQKLRNLLDKT